MKHLDRNNPPEWAVGYFDAAGFVPMEYLDTRSEAETEWEARQKAAKETPWLTPEKWAVRRMSERDNVRELFRELVQEGAITRAPTGRDPAAEALAPRHPYPTP